MKENKMKKGLKGGKWIEGELKVQWSSEALLHILNMKTVFESLRFVKICSSSFYCSVSKSLEFQSHKEKPARSHSQDVNYRRFVTSLSISSRSRSYPLVSV